MKQASVPHALLFSGMAGIGKVALARELAKLVNCLAPKGLDCCDECASCRKIDGNTHPDILWIKSEGSFIKIDQIRGLKDRLRYRPFEGKSRVLIIEEAQNLKEEAGNALLKLLEEPPRYNLFIVTAIEPQTLLPTIVSRCCHLRFQPLEDEWLQEYIAAAYPQSAARSREIARLSGGSLEKARWLAEEDRISHCKEVFDNIVKLSEQSMMEFFPLLHQWVQKGRDLEQDLEWIKLWVRDHILRRLGLRLEPILEQDPREATSLQKATVEDLFQLYDYIEQAIQNLRSNANKQLTLEGVCLAIRKAHNGQGSWNPLSSGRENLLF